MDRSAVERHAAADDPATAYLERPSREQGRPTLFPARPLRRRLRSQRYGRRRRGRRVDPTGRSRCHRVGASRPRRSGRTVIDALLTITVTTARPQICPVDGRVGPCAGLVEPAPTPACGPPHRTYFRVELLPLPSGCPIAEWCRWARISAWYRRSTWWHRPAAGWSRRRIAHRQIERWACRWPLLVAVARSLLGAVVLLLNRV